MTTGNKSYDWTSQVPHPFVRGATLRVGRRGSRNWSGSDSITATVPRTTFRTGQIGPREERRRYNPAVIGQIASAKAARDSQRAAQKAARARSRFLRMQLPPNPYNMVRVEEEVGVHTVMIGKTRIATAGVSQGTYNDFDDPAKYYQTVALLQDSVYGSGFAPAVFLAEGKQALGMISNAATRVRLALWSLWRFNPNGVLNALNISAPSQQWVRDMKRARRKYGNKAVAFDGVPEPALPTDFELIKRKGTVYKALSDLWIEVSYGWLPLLQDAEAGAQWLATAINSPPLQPRIKVSKSWKYAGTLNKGSNFTTVWSLKTTRRKCQLIVYGGQPVPVWLPNLASVAQVAWEKTPWSFAVDWFVPIGSYLSACSTAASITGRFVITQSWETDWSNPVSTSVGYQYSSLWSGNERLHRFQVTRTVGTTLPIKHPLTDLLDKDQSYKSWRHAANAVALLTQVAYTKKPQLFS